MSMTTTAGAGTRPAAAGPRATVVRRMGALGRAELTLLSRNRTAMFTALAMPLAMVFVTRTFLDQGKMLKDSGLDLGQALVTCGFGMVLIMVVYTTLVSSLVTRREEKVLKRLRTGESADWEIVASTALPVVVLAVLQIGLFLAAGVAVMDLAAPERPDLLAAAVLLGVPLAVLMAAVTTVLTRTTESSQVTTLPVTLVSMLASGMLLPLDVLPDQVRALCELLPFTPAVRLAQAGLGGGMPAGEALQAAGLGVSWLLVTGWAVRRWFRWEPRG